MSTGKRINLGLKAFDELFMDDQGREESNLPKIYEIPISEIDDFPNHPYKVRLDEDMDQLVESIRERGIITPITLRKKDDGRYEIVSGHRRKKACEMIGLDTVRAEIKELSRDEAIILMVESNLQRSEILPSEKAFSYKMRLDAMKRQAGRPSNENLVPVGQNYSREELAGQTGESQTQIQRYIRLTDLIPELIEMVDERQIALRPAVELSYLPENEQNILLDTMALEVCTPSHAQAIKIRKFSSEGRFNEDVAISILGEEKPNQKEKYKFAAERLRPYIPSSVAYNQTEDYVIKALEHYQRFREKRQQRDAR